MVRIRNELGRALLFLFHRHGHVCVGRQPDLVAFDVGDEPLVDEVMVAPVAALAAVLLGQLDAVTFDLVDRADMDTVGADGVHIGTVDKVEGNRIKLTKKDSGEGSHKGHHHFIDKGLVAGVEGNKVRLSAKAAVAVTMEEEK